MRKSDLNGTIHFKNRFSENSLIAHLLHKCCEHFLERNKQYDLASLVYAKLLAQSKHVKSVRRGKWWVRLCIDIKHLRMRKDCLRVCEAGLLDI